MKQQGTRKRHNRQYIAEQPASKARIVKVHSGSQLEDLFRKQSDDVIALQKLYLSCRILHQIYANGLDHTKYSQMIRKLVKSIRGEKRTKTISNNMKTKIEKLKELGFLFGAEDLEVKNLLRENMLPHYRVVIVMMHKIGVESLTGKDKELIISYLESLREILQKPEWHFINAIKILRNKNRIVRRLVGAEKSDPILKKLWEQDSLNWEEISENQYDSLIDKIEHAFKN